MYKRVSPLLVIMLLVIAIPTGAALAEDETPPVPVEITSTGEAHVDGALDATGETSVGGALDATGEKSAGGVTVRLTTTLFGLDYGSYEDVRGRNESQVFNTTANNVSYLQAGGALLKGGYGGQQMATTDTGNVPNTLYVDTGYTSYYRGYTDYWIMTGHSYWSIWVGYQWQDNVWADASHQF